MNHSPTLPVVLVMPKIALSSSSPRVPLSILFPRMRNGTFWSSSHDKRDYFRTLERERKLAKLTASIHQVLFWILVNVLHLLYQQYKQHNQQ